jgi:prevent-host-death family protein
MAARLNAGVGLLLYQLFPVDIPFISLYNLDSLARRSTVNRIWQLQEAKNKFSEVVEEALSHGPQVITKRGVETVIILSYTEYRALLAKQQTLSSFFRQSALVNADLDLSRDQSDLRDTISL